MTCRFFLILSRFALILIMVLGSGQRGRAEHSGENTVFSIIDETVNSGDIDDETALVQKVFAIFQPERLQARFQTEGLHPVKCATPMFMEIRNNWAKLTPETRTILGPYLLRPTESGGQEPYGHPYDDSADPQYYDSPGGHFRIWYVTTTDDAPEPTDVNPSDGIPDYINQCADVFDTVWEQEVVGLDMQAPPEDGSWYPGGEEYGGDSRYDVYIEDLGQSIFGYTQGEYIVPGTSRSASSYIVLDDDYVWYPNYNPGKQPIDGLKVTAAHEFFHAIHFGYDAIETSDRYWMEISAVWMENVVYDSVDDYLAYLYWFFTDPGISLDEFNGRHEYASCIWAMFLDQMYGPDIIRDIWERCASTSALSAFDAALTDKGSTLEEAFQLFTVWNWFTGSRANQSMFYEEGAHYPQVTVEIRHTTYPASGSGRLDHLAAHYIGFKPEGTTGGLETSFDGGLGINWGAMVIEYQSPTHYFFETVDLDNQHQGTHATRNWGNYGEIILVPGIVSVQGRNFSYTYEGLYDPSLGASLVPSAASHDFGSLTFGDSTVWTLTISNEGLDDRVVTAITLSTGPFRIPAYTVPFTIPRDSLLGIPITFAPAQIGEYTSHLTIASDDSIAPTLTVSLAGKGAAPAVSYALFQNFPNPFRTWEEPNRTYFPFTLQDRVDVTIRIFSINGQLVRVLDLGPGLLEAGSYQDKDVLDTIKAYWDGTNEEGEKVASGVYLYVLHAGDETYIETRKLALIK